MKEGNADHGADILLFSTYLILSNQLMSRHTLQMTVIGLLNKDSWVEIIEIERYVITEQVFTESGHYAKKCTGL